MIQDDEDIFATPSRSSLPPKDITKDEDLFNDDTDIFADIPSSKSKKKKSDKSSLFKDDVGK